jgi:hypothetical protein
LLGYSQYCSIAKVSHRNGPSFTGRDQGGIRGTSPSTKSDTHPEVSLISTQIVPYQTLGGTCCPEGKGVQLLRIGP